MMTCQILTFGIARDITGQTVLPLELPAGASVGDLKKLIFEKFPAFQSLTSMRIAVNAEFAEDHLFLNEKDEIALIPPVSGG